MIANILIALVALLHAYFMYLEMIAWDTPAGRKAFGLTPEFSEASRALAANQGLYNGFLVAGLVWGLWLGDAGFSIKAFFLGCVIVAGLFGWAMEPADDPEKHHDDHHEHTPGAELAVTGAEETGNG